MRHRSQDRTKYPMDLESWSDPYFHSQTGITEAVLCGRVICNCLLKWEDYLSLDSTFLGPLLPECCSDLYCFMNHHSVDQPSPYRTGFVRAVIHLMFLQSEILLFHTYSFSKWCTLHIEKKWLHISSNQDVIQTFEMIFILCVAYLYMLYSSHNSL